MKSVIKTLALTLFMAAAASAQHGALPADTDTRQSLKIAKSATKLRSGASDPRIIRLGPSTTYLKQGIHLNEVLRLLGKPVTVSERLAGDVHLATYVFPRSEGRILVAEFENGVLVRSDTMSSETSTRTKS